MVLTECVAVAGVALGSGWYAAYGSDFGFQKWGGMMGWRLLCGELWLLRLVLAVRVSVVCVAGLGVGASGPWASLRASSGSLTLMSSAAAVMRMKIPMSASQIQLLAMARKMAAEARRNPAEAPVEVAATVALCLPEVSFQTRARRSLPPSRGYAVSKTLSPSSSPHSPKPLFDVRMMLPRS